MGAKVVAGGASGRQGTCAGDLHRHCWPSPSVYTCMPPTALHAQAAFDVACVHMRLNLPELCLGRSVDIDDHASAGYQCNHPKAVVSECALPHEVHPKCQQVVVLSSCVHPPSDPSPWLRLVGQCYLCSARTVLSKLQTLACLECCSCTFMQCYRRGMDEVMMLSKIWTNEVVPDFAPAEVAGGSDWTGWAGCGRWAA